MAYSLYKNRTSINACDVLEEKRKTTLLALCTDIARIVLGAVAIFVAAHFLVEQAVYLATALSIPASLVGLILLSLGTNVPEIVIAIRSLMRRRADLALGDYLGSATMNTAIFGFLAIGAGTFYLEASEFIMTAVLLTAGLILMYVFTRTRNRLERWEGIVLLCFYVAFIALQAYNVYRFAGT
jgi:cation:H+ antiporter